MQQNGDAHLAKLHSHSLRLDVVCDVIGVFVCRAAGVSVMRSSTVDIVRSCKCTLRFGTPNGLLRKVFGAEIVGLSDVMCSRRKRTLKWARRQNIA